MNLSFQLYHSQGLFKTLVRFLGHIFRKTGQLKTGPSKQIKFLIISNKILFSNSEQWISCDIRTQQMSRIVPDRKKFSPLERIE